MSERVRKVQKVCGDSQVTRRAVCSFDSKYLLVACGSAVRVYSTHTGELVEELMHHSDTVTDVVLDKKDKAQVYTASLDGQIALWDYKDGGLLKTISVGRPILRLCLCSSGGESSLYVSVRNSEGKVMVCGLPSVLFTTSQPKELDILTQDPPVLTLGKKSNEIAITFDSKYLVTSDKKQLVLYDIESETTVRYPTKAVISSLACHPTTNCIATGAISGEIFLWYNVGGALGGGDVVKTRLHWHAHAVADVCFSTDGTYLLSGGEEAVLVLWQLANEQKHFRPRLGAPILGVACCPGDQTFAVSLKNNAIQLVSGIDNEVSCTIVQLYRSLPELHETNGVLPTGLVCDPRTHSIVLSGLPGQLQFFDCQTANVKHQLEVIRLNVTSRPHKKPLTPTVLSHTAFSSSGLWLATNEEWNNGVLSAERRLKFWRFDSEAQTHVLNTCIDPPHQSKVTGLLFRPRTSEYQFQSDLAVTTSLDGTFKVWVCYDEEKSSKKRVSWVCRSEGQYYSLPCHGCCFSEDGSLLALNNHKYVTLWEPLSCEHRKTFNSSVSEDRFKQVTFGTCNGSHLLLASSAQCFQVWNLLTCEVVATVPLVASVMVADPFSDCAAIFTSTELYFFSSRAKSPVLVQSELSSITGAVFVPVVEQGKAVTSQLYFMNDKQVLFTLTDSEQDSSKKRNIEDVVLEDSRQIFNDIFGASKGKSLPSDHQVRQSHHKPSTILDAPPHLLPPMSTVCKQFLLSLLFSTDAITKSSSDFDEEVDIDSDEEEVIASDSEGDQESNNGSSAVHGMRKGVAECVAMDTSPDTTIMDEVEGTIARANRQEDEAIPDLDTKYDWLVDFFRKEMAT